MTQPVSAFTITVPLSFTEHELAQKHSRLKTSSAEAKQAYLNTLAVCLGSGSLQRGCEEITARVSSVKSINNSADIAASKILLYDRYCF